jgi:ribosomal 50S subunit-associated protein YjgA (DUF615 family)
MHRSKVCAPGCSRTKDLHDIAETYPGADLQQLRVLRRNAIKERAEQAAAGLSRAVPGAARDRGGRHARDELEGEGEE